MTNGERLDALLAHDGFNVLHTRRRWQGAPQTAAPLTGIKALSLFLSRTSEKPLRNLVWLNKTDNKTAESYLNKQGGKKLPGHSQGSP